MGIVFSEGNREARFYWWQLQVSQSEGSSHLLQAGACACLCSSLGNNSWVHTRWCVHTCLHLHTCVWVFVHVCLCVHAYAVVPLSFSHPASSAVFVLFRFPPLLAGNKHWLSVSSLRSSFRSRGSGGWANVVQECQALFRKLGFCFVPLLNRVACGFVLFCLPWSQTRTWSSVLSSSCRLFSFMGPREMATETWSLDTQPCQLWLEKLSTWPHM